MFLQSEPVHLTESRYPEPTAGALIQDSDGRILLIKSHKFNDLYTIPGGHIELGETAEEALRREIREETGLDIRDVEFLLYQDFVFDDSFWKKKHFIFLDFACRTDCTEVEINEEAQEYVWSAPEEALALPIDRYTAKAIEVLLARRSLNRK